jgi:hypothetical protein
MRPWIDRMNDTENMIKRLNKDCDKCRKAGGDGCNGYSPDCKTFQYLQLFNNRKKDLLAEGGGVK